MAKANATFEGRSEETTKPLHEGVIESLPLPETESTVDVLEPTKDASVGVIESLHLPEAATATVVPEESTTETVESAPTDAEGKE